MKVFILGFDGLTFKVLEPYMDAGLLPNFKRVRDEGSWGILRSTLPSVTPPGWISISTGKNPGKYDIYEFGKLENYRKIIVTKNDSPEAEPLWSILSRKGKKVNILNVPLTYPPDEVNGVMVSGMMTPGTDSEFTYPRALREEILKLIPGYSLDVENKKFFYSGKKKALVEEAFKITHDLRKLTKHFLTKGEWDLFFTVFIGPDRLQHFLWKEILSREQDCVRYYMLLDEILGDMLSSIDGQTSLFIVSDHGFTNAEKAFHINNFFESIGLLRFNKDKSSLKSAGMKNFIMSVMYRSGALELARRLPKGIVTRLKDKFIARPEVVDSEINWDGTRVFSLLNYGVINVNLKGREARGTVERDDYEKLCEKLKESLLSFKDPKTGGKVIKEVYRFSDLYPGKGMDAGPDLIAVPNDGYRISTVMGTGIIGNNKLLNMQVTADHNAEGVYMVWGPHIKNKRLDAQVYNIMPSVLYLMGQAVPNDVDGRVLTDIIDEGFLEKNLLVYEDGAQAKGREGNALHDAETDELKKRLERLGYLS